MSEPIFSHINVNESLFAVACDALHILNKSSYEGYIVGGFVRDALLGRPQNDIDIATNAPYRTLCNLFAEAGWGVFRTGEKHGTATVVKDGIPVEITHYRSDGPSADHRHPVSVNFVESLEEDLARRDFTINALAYHPHHGLVDCFNGVQHLSNRILVCVGDPTARFEEDALRILRGLRFSAQLGFAIEEKTAQAMHACAPLLEVLSVERIYKECTGLLMGDHSLPLLLGFQDALRMALPPLRTLSSSAYESNARCVERAEAQEAVRWCLLLHGVSDLKSALTYLKMSRAIKERILLLSRALQCEPPRRVIEARKLIHNLNDDPTIASELLEAQEALGVKGALNAKDFVAQAAASTLPYQLKGCALSGNDLIAAGVKPGPDIQRILAKALDAVMEERVENETAALLAYVLN